MRCPSNFHVRAYSVDIDIEVDAHDDFDILIFMIMLDRQFLDEICSKFETEVCLSLLS